MTMIKPVTALLPLVLASIVSASWTVHLDNNDVYRCDSTKSLCMVNSPSRRRGFVASNYATGSSFPVKTDGATWITPDGVSWQLTSLGVSISLPNGQTYSLPFECTCDSINSATSNPTSSPTSSPTVNWVDVITQIGGDIDGDFAKANAGTSVSISDDGTRVAVGAPGDNSAGDLGYVKIYTQVSGSWVQVGSRIDGQVAHDKFGHSVALSADGKRVVIGAWTGNYVGIFAEVGGNWVQVGSQIDGESNSDASGYGDISISNDGSRVVIGAVYNDGAGNAAGHARIFAEVDGNWVQVGSDIDGERAGDYAGRSVSLSADGSRVAIGVPYDDGAFVDAGTARIYDDVDGNWVQVGSDIDGAAADDLLGYGSNVKLSSDGTRVAVGAFRNDDAGDAAGHVRIYTYVGGNWVQVGSDIDGEAAGDGSGLSLSLSSDGTRVAIGAQGNDGTSASAGHVRIFADVNGNWVQVGPDIDGESRSDKSGCSVSLSADGSLVAIGAYMNAGGGLGAGAGHARVYALPEF